MLATVVILKRIIVREVLEKCEPSMRNITVRGVFSKTVTGRQVLAVEQCDS